MIENTTQLEVAIEQLATFQRMHEAMRLDLQRAGSSLFPTVSEGYSRRIEVLQEEIIEYLRERPAEAPVAVRMSGPMMRPGVIRATLVGSLITGFQTALYRVGKVVGAEYAEVTDQALEGARSIFRLNLIATAPGSFVLAMDLAPRQQLSLFDEYDMAASAVEKLISYVNELQEGPSHYTGDPTTLRGLQKVALLVKKEVEAIEIFYHDKGHRAEAKFNSDVRQRIEYLLGAPDESERIVRGRLIQINVESRTCKVHPTGQSPVRCDYDESLEEDLISALKQDVELAGEFDIAPSGNPVITKIERFRVLDDEDADLD